VKLDGAMVISSVSSLSVPRRPKPVIIVQNQDGRALMSRDAIEQQG